MSKNKRRYRREDKGTSLGQGSRNDGRRNVREVVSEFVPVPLDLKGYIIGRNGSTIAAIQAESGARIYSQSYEDQGFTISGTQEERECAKKRIEQKLQSKRAVRTPLDQPVKIPKKYKGLVIGKGGDNLQRISTRTGAQFRPRGNDLCVSGTAEEVQQAKLQIGLQLAAARLKPIRFCCYIDGRNLPENCDLNLVPVTTNEHMLVLGSKQTQYRLTPTEEYAQEGACGSSVVPSYHADLIKNALYSLGRIKLDIEAGKCVNADMWCHFGACIIRRVDEADVDEFWSIKEASRKLGGTKEKHNWHVAFKEGVNLDATLLEKTFGRPTPQSFIARYDLTFLTPSSEPMRCKVWVANKEVQSNLEEIPIPFNDIKNVVDEIRFEDAATDSRCRGWIVQQSQKYFQADIIYPGSGVDCRIHMRAKTGGSTRPRTRLRLEIEEHVKCLSNFLSKLTFSDADGLRLPEEKLPEGFLFNHMRCASRKMYTPRLGFAIIVSKESSWSSDFSEEETRETTDLHLHCEDWDRLLNDVNWEPKMIISKLPEFLDFVHEVHDLVCSNDNMGSKNL